MLAVIRVDGFEQALAVANGTDFGLTGAVYTRDPARIAQAEDEFFVGNLYINRKCTGALVGVHPLRRIQHERHRLQGGWAGLPFAVLAGQINRGRPLVHNMWIRIEAKSLDIS